LTGEEIMKLNQVKLFAIIVIALPVFVIAAFVASPAHAVSGNIVSGTAVLNNADDYDVGAEYKKACAVCHKATAEKFFEPSKMDEVLVEIVLKGKKAEKPPHMPGYEAKGMTDAQAKLLVAYMRQMRTPASQ
jgi:mono/diheme cytochrome c family protein